MTNLRRQSLFNSVRDRVVAVLLLQLGAESGRVGDPAKVEGCQLVFYRKAYYLFDLWLFLKIPSLLQSTSS